MTMHYGDDSRWNLDEAMGIDLQTPESCFTKENRIDFVETNPIRFESVMAHVMGSICGEW